MQKPSRSVTPQRKCGYCQDRFRPRRADSRFCSGRCRQRAHRARVSAGTSDLDKQILAARLLYWKLVYQKAVIQGVDVTRIVTDEAHYVDEEGNVFKGFPGSGGPWVGRIKKENPGWSGWGLEAGGPPFDPPMEYQLKPRRRRKKKKK